MSSRAQGYVGQGIPMREAGRYTQGRGRYVNDPPRTKLAHVAFARSTEAHGRITRLDVTAAREHPDAIAVLTAADLEDVIVGRYWGGWDGTSTADYFPLAREKVLKVAAHQLEVSPADLEMANSAVQVKGNPATSVSLREIAHTVYFKAAEVPDDVLPEPTIEETAHFDPPNATFANATHAVILEIDPATAHIKFLKYVIVHDCGTIINPLIVDGQLYGATAQGIGATIPGTPAQCG